MSRPETDKLDQLTWDELDEDLQDLAASQRFSTVALLAIQQTRLLKQIAWSIEDIRTDWPGVR